MPDTLASQVTVHEMTPQEGLEAFDAACKRELGVSGDVFRAAFESGIYPQDWSQEAICRMEMLLPMAV